MNRGRVKVKVPVQLVTLFAFALKHTAVQQYIFIVHGSYHMLGARYPSCGSVKSYFHTVHNFYIIGFNFGKRFASNYLTGLIPKFEKPTYHIFMYRCLAVTSSKRFRTGE